MSRTCVRYRIGILQPRLSRKRLGADLACSLVKLLPAHVCNCCVEAQLGHDKSRPSAQTPF